MQCEHLPTGKCILHIQPFMYTIIHTQTTSVGTDLICWTWTVSINLTSLKINQGHFFTSPTNWPLNAHKRHTEENLTRIPTGHLKILGYFLNFARVDHWCHKFRNSTGHIIKLAIRFLPTRVHFVYHLCIFKPKCSAQLLSLCVTPLLLG